MTYLLNASACPPVATWDAFAGNSIGLNAAFTTGPTAPVSRSFSAGQTTTVTPSLTYNAAVQDVNARWGGGIYAVALGLTLSAGTGLQAVAASGLALMDGPIEVPASLSVPVPASQTSVWIWLLRPAPGGVPSLFASASLALPASPAVLLGRVTTSAAGVTAADYSGIVQVRGGNAFRQTADAGAPTDAPPVTTSFFAITAGGRYLWDGVAYSALVPPAARRTLVTLPAHSVTLTPGENGAVGVDFSGLGSFASACYSVSAQASDTTIQVSENTGPKTTGKAFLHLYEPSAGSGAAFNLTVILEGAGWVPNSSLSAPGWDAVTVIG